MKKTIALIIGTTLSLTTICNAKSSSQVAKVAPAAKPDPAAKSASLKETKEIAIKHIKQNNKQAEQKPVAVAMANSNRSSESEVSHLKEIVADKSGKITLKDKIRALVKLSEVEGKEISEFLEKRKAQLDADPKSAGFASDRENNGFKSAVARVVNSRNQIRVAEGN